MSDIQSFAVIYLFLAGFCCISMGVDQCIPAKGYEGCACYRETVNKTKEYVNLLPLKTDSSIPRFTVMDKDGYYISYSPCGVFSEFVGENMTGYSPCIEATVARWTNISVHRCESLGEDANATFVSTVDGDDGGFITSNLTLKFRSGEKEHHSAIISLVCNDTLPESKSYFRYINTSNMPTDTYYLELTSKCCCPGKCGSPPEPPPSQSTGPSSAPPTGHSTVVSSSVLKTFEMGLLTLVAGNVYTANT
ncbi:unnamed protein product [Porites lobata]|uniref:Uncharacterized protein n=1 Tax=Porites lobata TaxID=104759 RepID=A0ABN8PV23_9CNID|nr:unnamed protein product [Porites lobata]